MDISVIYTMFREIKSSNDSVSSREALAQLSKLVESRGRASNRNMIFNDLSKLMECLNLMLGSAEFKLFYDFVFFICRENGQKNISVTIAVKAWRLVLKGRFRLLNQWCDFVEKHYGYNISEDTWQQLLVFSRCVDENLKGYDPKGSWPVLIDDFVEHMHGITGSNCCPSTQNFFELVDMETQMECGSLPGLALHSGSKRRSPARTYEYEFETLSPSKSKRSRWTYHH